MKLIYSIILVGLVAVSCKSIKYYGEKIAKEEALSYEDVMKEAYTKGSIHTMISGTILETCAKKGCWMSMATKTDTVFVRFRDYGFFVPTAGVEGRTAIVEGDLFVDTISVRMLQHYAKDAGKTNEEINKITAPELGLSFTADGVVIRKP